MLVDTVPLICLTACAGVISIQKPVPHLAIKGVCNSHNTLIDRYINDGNMLFIRGHVR